MADLISEMLGKFAELAQEEKNINSDIDKALKEYNDYCKSSDEDLNRKLEEIRGKIRKVSEYMQYAREHATDLEEAQMPFETSEGSLESIRQTIKLDSHNDPNAESLYTKASGQKLFYEAEMERTRKLIEGSKVQAKRQYDSDVAALEGRKEKHDKDLHDYVLSEEFKRYLQLLSFDKSAFNSQSTVNLIDKSKISIGQRRIRFSVPMEVEQDLTTVSGGEYNAASRTIGAPFGVSTQEGSVLMLEYDERNQAYLMGGVERLLLNFIKYCGQNITDMVYFDDSPNAVDNLGIMSMFARGINSFIVVPQSPIEANSKMAELYTQIKETPTPDCVTRVIALRGFPEEFSSEFSAQVLELARDAKQNGVLLIVIHNGTTPDTDTVTELRSIGQTIRSRNGSFYIDNTRESLFWYSKPTDIPDTVRRTYVEQRRMAAQQAVKQPAPQPAPTVQPAASTVQPVVQPAPVAQPVVQPAAPTVEPVAQPAVQPVQPVQPVRPAAVEAVQPVQPTPAEEKPAEQPVEAAKPEEQPEPAKPIEQPVEAAQPEEPKKENNKGLRVVPKIVLGADEKGLDISGNVAYICGKNGEDKTKIVKAVIDQISSKTHPDSAELWLFDNDGSIISLIDPECPHIKYAVSDENDETAADLVELLIKEKASRAELFSEKNYADYSEIPADVYLPRAVVVISDFADFLRSIDRVPKYLGRDLRRSLESLFKNCADYGINIVLVGSTFSENGKAPDVFVNGIKCAAAIPGKEKALETLFGYKAGIIHDRFVLVSGSNVAIRINVPAQGEPKNYVLSYEYDDDPENYLGKRPLIADRRASIPFGDRSSARSELISQKENNEIMLFLGEPNKASANAPMILRAGYGENVLEVVPKGYAKPAALTVAAALKSLEEQGVPAEIIAAKDDPIYSELYISGMLNDVKVSESDRIKELADNATNELLVILGGDVLMASLHAEDQNAAADLKKLLVKGPKNGLRVMFVCTSVNQMQAGFLSLFRHKAVFPCPEAEAEKLLQSCDCCLMNNAFRISTDGEEYTAVPYKI